MTQPDLQAAPEAMVDLRESVWVRIALTAAWAFCLLVLIAELRSAYQGRFVIATLVILAPAGLICIAQGIVLHGWPRRIASWCLLPAFVGLGALLVSLFMIIPPRWFPVASLWVIAIVLWGVGIVWWRGSWRGVVVAWCLLPVMMLLALAGNRGAWSGRTDHIPGGDVAMMGSMDWFGEDPDVFAVLGMTMPGFATPRMMLATVGAIESVEYLDGLHEWELVAQRQSGRAIAVKAEYGTRTNANHSAIQVAVIAADGSITMEDTVTAHGPVTMDMMKSVETGGSWRVFPRLVVPGDPAMGPSGVTFVHRDTSEMVHVSDIEPEWIFPTEDPDRFACIIGDLVRDNATNKWTEALLHVEVDVSAGGAINTIVQHATPHDALTIMAAHPATGVILAPFPVGRAPTSTNHSSIEHLDWETGALTVIAENVARENLRIVTHGEAMCALLIEPDMGRTIMRAHNGREERGTMAFHPADVLRDVALSPDGDKVALVIGRGFLPGLLAQLYATQVVLVWDLEADTLVELNAQPITEGMMGGIPMMGADESQRLQWSRDGRRLAQHSIGMRPFNTFNQWGSEIYVYHYGEWAGEE